jgi:hypothetical protein
LFISLYANLRLKARKYCLELLPSVIELTWVFFHPSKTRQNGQKVDLKKNRGKSNIFFPYPLPIDEGCAKLSLRNWKFLFLGYHKDF